MRKSRESGQSVVELIVTILAFFTMAFMYVQVALGFGVANYIQYATFMAARAFLSSEAKEADQKKQGEKVLELMLRNGNKDRFKSIAQGSGDGNGLVPGAFVGAKTERVVLGARRARQTAWEQGASYKFKMRLYMMPLVKGAKRGAANQVEFTSEAWLGRDPSEEECINQLRDRKSKAMGADAREYLYDNGC